MASPDARRYAVAFAAVSAAVLVARVLDPYIAPHISGPYFLAVMLVAAYAGAGPGLFATFMASVAAAWFDLGTMHRLDLGADDLLRLAVFAVNALVISSISAATSSSCTAGAFPPTAPAGAAARPSPRGATFTAQLVATPEVAAAERI